MGLCDVPPFDGNAVVRGDDLPRRAGLHPNISQAIVILVPLAIRLPAFMIGAGHDGDIPMDAYLKIGQFSNLDMHRTIGAVHDVARLAERVAILNRDHEILRQQ